MTQLDTQPRIVGKSNNIRVHQQTLRDSHMTDNKPKILNFSKYVLLEDEIKLLNKGLKFCPTPATEDLMELEVNIKELVRKVELKVFMANKNWGSYNSDHLLSKSGKFMPPENKEKTLSSVISNLISTAESLENYPKPQVFNNLTSGERKALTQLKNNQDIVIRPFDKGSGICILDKEWYINKITQIVDSNTYRKVEGNPDANVVKELHAHLNKYKFCFDKKDKEIDYIFNFDYQTANFYGNPKVHKVDAIKDILNSTNALSVNIDIRSMSLPFRCITAGKHSPLSRLSELTDLLLKPFETKIKSHIRDAVDFRNKLRKVPPSELEDTIVVTGDADNMFGSIEMPLGTNSVDYFLSTYPELLHHRFSKEFVLDSLKLILGNANFMFNNNYYTLSKGTVTGTTVSPTYANLTMAYLELQLYDRVRHKYGEAVEQYVIENWKRFLDDGFILWKKSFGPISEFFDILNSLDPNINFTYNSSNIGLPFLQLFVYKTDTAILTDIYYKDTDSHDYLPSNSCHPRHTLRNIPFNLARNICTLVDDSERKDFRLKELKKWLRKGGYKPDLIDSALKKARDIDPAELRAKVVREEEETITFVHTHNPHNPHVYADILSNFNFLKKSHKYKNIFAKVRLIKSERQPKNLYRHLVHSNVVKPKFNPGSKKCGSSRCGTCDHLLESKSILFRNVGAIYNLTYQFDCLSKDIIYKIICIGCDEYYIGQTVHLRNRVSKHKNDVKNEEYRKTKLHKHIYNCAGVNGTPFQIIPFFKVQNATTVRLEATEDYFVRKYRPTLNTRKVVYSHVTTQRVRNAYT